MGYSIGIDLGTTNTVLSVGRRGFNGEVIVQTEEIEQIDEDGMGIKTDKLLPSVLYIEDGIPSVGIIAKAMKGQTLDNIIFNSKNRIGEDECIWKIENKEYTPEIVASYFLKAVRKQLEERYGYDEDDSLNRAVITVPASFNSDQKNATKRAAQIAGFKDEIILISEPTAAILDLINEESKRKDEDRVCDFSEFKNVLVFDLGGGTCDVSILRIKLKGKEVYVEEEGVSPHTLIGGTSFDVYGVNGVLRDYEKENKIKLDEILSKSEFRVLKGKLLVVLEKVKTFFSSKILNSIRNGVEVDEENIKFPIQIPGVINGNPFKYEISIKKYNEYISSLLDENSEENIIKPIKEALNTVDYTNEDIDYIFCVGGMTRYKKVVDVLEEYLGKKVLKLTDTMESVSRGAAIYHYYEIKGVDELEKSEYEYDTKKKYIVTPKLPQSVFLNVKNGLPVELIKAQTKAEVVVEHLNLLEVTSEVGITLDLYVGRSIYDPNLKGISNGTINFEKGVPLKSKISLTIEYRKDGSLEFNAWIEGMEDIKINLAIEGEKLEEREILKIRDKYNIDRVGGIL
ncbi:MAG: Hsp70 family protein [Clostridium sp.]